MKQKIFLLFLVINCAATALNVRQLLTPHPSPLQPGERIVDRETAEYLDDLGDTTARLLDSIAIASDSYANTIRDLQQENDQLSALLFNYMVREGDASVTLSPHPPPGRVLLGERLDNGRIRLHSSTTVILRLRPPFHHQPILLHP